MRELCKKYGGVVETLKAVNEFNDLDEIRRERRRFEAEVKRLRSEVERLRGVKEELHTEISQRRAMINAANTALIAGFNTASLSMISALAKNLGGPYKVADAIQKYSSLREMDEELEAKKAELENVKKETSDKTQFLNALNYTLNEVTEEYDRNSDVRMVVELLVNPRGIKMDRPAVVSILTRVLDSGARRIEEIPEILSMPSPAWHATYESVKALADRLRSLSEGT
jgi:DNA repair exonuclease SbcCD ATPase subunit